MKRTIKKQVWLNRTEARELQKKAKKACLSEAGLVRMLISGYEPRQQPDESFYELAEAAFCCREFTESDRSQGTQSRIYRRGEV